MVEPQRPRSHSPTFPHTAAQDFHRRLRTASRPMDPFRRTMLGLHLRPHTLRYRLHRSIESLIRAWFLSRRPGRIHHFRSHLPHLYLRLRVGHCDQPIPFHRNPTRRILFHPRLHRHVLPTLRTCTHRLHHRSPGTTNRRTRNSLRLVYGKSIPHKFLELHSLPARKNPSCRYIFRELPSSMAKRPKTPHQPTRDTLSKTTVTLRLISYAPASTPFPLHVLSGIKPAIYHSESSLPPWPVTTKPSCHVPASSPTVPSKTGVIHNVSRAWMPGNRPRHRAVDTVTPTPIRFLERMDLVISVVPAIAGLPPT
jgi:hypothetical protein